MPGLPITNLPSVETTSGQKMSLGTFQATQPRPAQTTEQRTTFQQRPDPMAVVEDEVRSGQAEINDYFNQMKYELDQQNLEPEEYLKGIANLREQVRQHGISLRYKAEAKLQSMNQIIKLMEDKNLDTKMGQRSLWRIAGYDDETINAMMPKEKQVDWTKEHAQNMMEQNRVNNVLRDYRVEGNKLEEYDFDNSTKTKDVWKKVTDPIKIEEYKQNINYSNNLRQQRNVIIQNLSPMAQTAGAGQRVMLEKQSMPFNLPRFLKGMAGGLIGIGSLTTAPIRARLPREGQNVLHAVNPKTGQRITSNDGGKTWQ